jgi:competence protein ComEC
LSGFNVALIVAPLGLLLLFAPVRKEIKIILIMAVVWMYLAFTGFIPSLFRAVIMATVFMSSFLFQRKNYALNSLGFAGVLWLLAYPMSLFTAGFQLSFTATAGLLTLFPLMYSMYRPPRIGLAFEKAVTFFVSAGLLTLAAFVSTAPILAYHFGLLSLFGIPANLVASGLMSISLWTFLGGAAVQTLSPALSYPVFAAAEQFMGVLMSIAGVSQRFSWSQVAVNVPPYLELYCLYAVLMAGTVVVRRELLGKYVYWALPLGVAGAPAIILLRNFIAY